MALTLEFIGAKPGEQCELFRGEPYSNRELRGKIDPIHTAKLDDKLKVTLPSTKANGYAVRLLNSSGKVYARSNTRPLNSKTRLFVLPITRRIPQAEFATFAPPMPFVEGRTTFDRLQLDFAGGGFRVFGHALHDGVFNKRFTFDYRFQIRPVHLPVWVPVSQLEDDEVPEDTFEFKTTSLTIDTDRNRQEALLAILHLFIRRRFRQGLQRRFHEAALEQVQDNILKPVLTLNSTKVETGKQADLNFTVLGETL